MFVNPRHSPPISETRPFAAGQGAERAPGTVEELLHELQAHQVELEMQNEQLCGAEVALAESRDLYLDLFEFAPVGYMTLTDRGLIAAINRTGADLLKTERSALINRRFDDVVVDENRDRWHRLFAQELQGEGNASCDLTLQGRSGPRVAARLNLRRARGIGADAAMHVTITDVTAIKEAHTALASSEQRFHAVFDQIGEAVVLYDVLGRRIVAANRSAGEMLVCTPDEIPKLGIAQISDDVPPYAEADALARLEAVFKGDTPDRVDWRVRDCKGRRFWVEVSLRRIAIGGEDLLLIVARDISERRAAAEEQHRGEERLVASETRFRDLFENAPLPYHSLDAAGVLLDVNHAWSQLFGFARAEVIGRHIGEFLTAASKDTLAVEFPRFKASGRVSGVVMDILCRDGSSRQVEVTGRTALDTGGQFLCTHCMLSDVTERNASLTALRDREERLRLLFSHAPIGIMTVTSDLRLTDVNEALCRLLGYSADELKWKRVEDITHPDDRAADCEGIGELRAGRSANGMKELRYLHRHGHAIWVRVTYAVIRDEAGSVTYGIGLVEDICERREAERLRVERLEQQRDVLVREVHHRIKNNLQGVISLIEQLQRKRPEATDALEEAAGQIGAIAVVHGLHSTMLSAEVKPRPLVLAIVDAVARLSGTAIACNECDDVADREWQLDVRDTVAIALVINELLYNALKHNVSKGVVEVSLGCRADAFRVSVRNRLARLPPGFNFRAGIGLGTGLTLVSSLLPQQGARLSIRQHEDGVEAELELTHPCVSTVPTNNQETTRP